MQAKVFEIKSFYIGAQPIIVVAKNIDEAYKTVVENYFDDKNPEEAANLIQSISYLGNQIVFSTSIEDIIKEIV